MERASFWRYFRYLLFGVLFTLGVINLANFIWQLGFTPTRRLAQDGDWLLIVLLGIGVFVLFLGVVLILFRLWRIEAHKNTAKTIQVALDQGYREQNIIPLSYAFSARSPSSERFQARTAGAPVLAWDADRVELFVNPPGAKAPYRALSGVRSGSSIELRRIALVHPIGGEHWGIQITFRRAVPTQDGTTQTWKFVPFPRGPWSMMRKAAVAELFAELTGSGTDGLATELRQNADQENR
ncbi:MAG: hypothetical protein IIZ13_11775 [Renibacterium sp.]|nr:hypothetical protein [Renibacterium sp.]